jgi:hypothetical protein
MHVSIWGTRTYLLTLHDTLLRSFTSRLSTYLSVPKERTEIRVAYSNTCM